MSTMITTAQTATLEHLSTLLHLFHHRNKNQHRHSIWYRHFSTLRQQLNRLLSELTTLNFQPKTHLEKAKKKVQDPITQSRLRRRLDFWRDILLPKWQHAFSQLIAHRQFAVLGVVLMAIVAEICGVVGITGELEEIGEREVRRVIEEFGREEWVGEESGMPVERDAPLGSQEDVGEVIGRGEEDAGVGESVAVKGGETETPPETAEDETTKNLEKSSGKKRRDFYASKPKKKRKKSGSNVIDDIFG